MRNTFPRFITLDRGKKRHSLCLTHKSITWTTAWAREHPFPLTPLLSPQCVVSFFRSCTFSASCSSANRQRSSWRSQLMKRISSCWAQWNARYAKEDGESWLTWAMALLQQEVINHWQTRAFTPVRACWIQLGENQCSSHKNNLTFRTKTEAPVSYLDLLILLP